MFVFSDDFYTIRFAACMQYCNILLGGFVYLLDVAVLDTAYFLIATLPFLRYSSVQAG